MKQTSRLLHVCQKIATRYEWQLPYLLLPLSRKVHKALQDDAGIGAVIHVDGRAAHPSLQVVYGERNVLGVTLQERQR